MMIFLLAISMMVAMAVSALVLLIEENAAKRQRVRSVPFDINFIRRLRN